MTKKLLLILFFIPAFFPFVFSQEVLKPLEVNPAKTTLTEKADHILMEEPILPLVLPFKDDFSYEGPYPDHRLWADSFVYVNPGFAFNPRTVGNATFDALNQYGFVYPESVESTFQFDADMLSSHPLRLDSVFAPASMALSPADSVLLTFYFQPQGNGSAPRDRDSLVVELLHTPAHFAPDPDDEENQIWHEDLWVSVWRFEGSSLADFYENNGNHWFKRVAIKIEDEAYFRPNFRFRFRNYASFPMNKTPDNYAGNTSIWNIDYVMLDYGRSVADSFYYDIAFAAPAQSILQTYQSMPWKQYIANPQAQLKARFNNAIANHDNITHNYTYRYFIQDEAGTNIKFYAGGTWNIAPYSTNGYQSYEQHTNPIVIPNPLPTAPAKARQFYIYHIITEGTTGDDWQRNDTIRFRQVFDNYFAYDDGIPESGYGLVGNNARGAVRFILNRPDTLTSVQIYFNRTMGNQNQQNFELKVWKNLEPEIILYESGAISTEFPEGLNMFADYVLDAPLIVSDTIFIGWRQISNDFLNIGFDANNNAGTHIFYNTSGEWLPTIYEGALMIRPVFGEAFFTHIPTEKNQKDLFIYPNPATGNTIFVQTGLQDESVATIHLYDITGKTLASYTAATAIDISGLPNGMYLISATGQSGVQTLTQKFIIAR